MTNTVHEIQQWVADTLNADQWLRERDVAAYAENQLDIEAKVQSALDGVGIFAAVLTPVINHMGSDAGGAIMGELSELVVSVAESPTNRARPGACTALDAACRAAALIHSEVITFGALRQSLDESNGLVICNVTFATTIQVALINHED